MQDFSIFSIVAILPENLPVPKMFESWTIVYTIILLSSPLYITSQPFDYPTANLSTSWINSISLDRSISFQDNSTIRPVLLRGSLGPRYACGFYCNGNCETYLFAVFIVQTNSGGGIVMPAIGFPQVVWSANPNNPVRINSTLELTSAGDLVLRDVDGSLAWSTNTSGMSVTGLNLTELGNLVLFDSRNSIVWQSFDHPTDVLVPGQILVSGNNLTASASQTNWTQTGLFFLSMTSQGLVAFVDANPLLMYYENTYTRKKRNQEPSYAKFQNGSLQLYINTTEPNEPDMSIDVPVANSAQFIKLGPDGHLRVFEWNDPWEEVADLITGDLGECSYPMVCGKYGICTNDGQCSCPRSNSSVEYFRQINDRQPNLGCSEVVPITCDVSSSNQGFLDLEDLTYFSLFSFNPDIWNTDMNRCKEACLRNCSCKAAFLMYSSNSSTGSCYMPSEVFSFMNNEKDKTHYNSSLSIKVQMASSVVVSRNSEGRNSFLGPLLGSVGGILVLVGLAVFVYRKKKKSEEVEEDYLDHVPGMPTRFSHKELVLATNNFSKKLGQGGFGSVFEGSLKDNTRIAVKCLDGIGQIKKSFLAEVETIGSIHHVNLVRLVGFCAEKSHRLLVYEYMSNGSLDKWIYRRNRLKGLDMNHRRRIILDIAKGLAYLHEECRQKIIHLDIKPQNILLDENYSAKLGDFGLSKLMDRNQSKVVMTMRGTPGYLAPEWLSAVITEKVDVYSFGIVVLEILCGRRNFELSEPEEERHLLALFKKKAEEGQWLDLIDKSSDDMQLNGAEVVRMIQSAGWCLQSDHTRRPSMSMVIKVIEGAGDALMDLDFSLIIPEDLVNIRVQEIGLNDGSQLLPSVLSGPR